MFCYVKTITGREFIKRVRSHARAEGVKVRVVKERGKGSHQTLYYGTERLTRVKNPSKELGIGLLSDMIGQLGLTKEDLGL